MTTATDDLELEPTNQSPPDTSFIVDPGTPPIHEARCGECKGTVRYQLTATRHGLIVLSQFGYDVEQSFGIGAAGPICPNGHGEMELADDQLPAAEAFALAQEKMAEAAGHATQQQLPGVVLPFNFQGAYLELEEKAVEVDRLHDEYKSAAEEAKDAKKAWDKAAELYTKMALECRRRRKAKEGQPAEDLLDESEREPATNLVRCKWEEQHPGLICPICGNVTYAKHYFGADLAPRDSEGHLEQIQSWQNDREINGVLDALDAIDILVTAPVVRGWSTEDRAAVTAWATASFEARDDSTISIPDRPKVLGTAHVAGEGRDGESQCCTQCDAVLIEGGDEPNYYEPNVLVGTDCPGKAKAEGHHYPGKKKRASRKRPAAE